MVFWKEVLTQMTPDAEGRMAELRGRLYSQLGGVGPLKIVTFRGYGTPERLYLRGRVIEEKTYLISEKDDRVWDNLAHIYMRAQCQRVPGATLAARFQNVEQTITADEDGFFEVRLKPARSLVEQRIWHSIELQLISPIPDIQSRYPIKTTGQVLVPPAGARFGIISTIDRTLLPSGLNDLTRMARNTFLRTPHARLPFPGEAALHQALYSGLTGTEMNPVFYISTSSGELNDLLVQHINLQSMPSGPILFACSDPGSRIRRLLEIFPRLPFLLIGDAGQQDAETFTSLACAYPGRIPAIYLRSGGIDARRAEYLRALAERAWQSGSRLALANNALSFARLAVEQDFLPPAALDSIVEEMHKDELPPSPLEELISWTGETRNLPLKISHQAIKKEASPPHNHGVPAWLAQKPPLRRIRKQNK